MLYSCTHMATGGVKGLRDVSGSVLTEDPYSGGSRNVSPSQPMNILSSTTVHGAFCGVDTKPRL